MQTWRSNAAFQTNLAGWENPAISANRRLQTSLMQTILVELAQLSTTLITVWPGGDLPSESAIFNGFAEISRPMKRFS
jgi:hypothetical protein